MGSLWCQYGVILGHLGVIMMVIMGASIEVITGSLWGRGGVAMESLLCHHGSLWSHYGIIMGSLWDQHGVTTRLDIPPGRHLPAWSPLWGAI